MGDYLTPEVLGGMIRSMLIAAGMGGILDGNQLTALAGALAIVGSVLWSAWQKKRAADNKQDAVKTAANMVADGANPEHVVSLSKAGIL